MGYSEHPIAINVLSVVFVFAAYSMWGLSKRNGYIDALSGIRDQSPLVLPGSTVGLLEKYTGIGPLDYFLTVMQCFWANVTDGSAPHLSLLAFYFLGQLTAATTGLAVESQRSFNRGKMVSWTTIWGMAIQGLGFGIVMPIYAMLHLSTTNRFAATSKHTLGADLQAFPQALVIGLIIPSILAVLPVSSVLHQQFVAAWQFFPFAVLAAVFVNKPLLKPATTRRTRSQLSKAYGFGKFVALWTHRLTIATLLLIKIKPDYFPQSLVESLTFSNVFLPPNPFSSAQVSLVDGVLSFLKYDMFCGMFSAIVWQFSISDIYLHVDLVLDTVVKGPGYTFLRITEIRDEILFEIVQNEEDKSIKEGYGGGTSI